MQEVSPTDTIKSSTQQEFFLIEVIAMILRHIKDRLLYDLQGTFTGVAKATDFSWVITIPARWKARGKQMREAAYLVSY